MNDRRQIFPANGSSVELRNCLTEAQDRARQLDASARVEIDRAVAAGRFVVVEEIPYYCKSTDALAGTTSAMRASFATREQADADVQRRYDKGDGFDPDGRLYVLPAVPYCPPVGKADETDDVPF